MTETNNKMGSQTFDENDDLSYIVDSVLNSTGLKKSYRANPNCEWILLIGDEDVKEGIKNLSQMDQEIIRLFFFEGLTLIDIAARLDISIELLCGHIKAVKVRLKSYV